MFAPNVKRVNPRRKWSTISKNRVRVPRARARARRDFIPAFQERMRVDAQREERTAYVAIVNGNFALAKQHLLNASNYWWWKGWWDGARNARERAFDEQAMQRQAAAFHAEEDEQRARELLRGLRADNPFADLIAFWTASKCR